MPHDPIREVIADLRMARAVLDEHIAYNQAERVHTDSRIDCALTAIKDATATLDAIEAAGCVVVPVEPTQEMIHACAKAALVTIALHKLKAIWPWSKRSIVVENINRCWASMVAARPGAQP